MDQNTLLLLGSVKIRNVETGQEKIIEAKGFDVLGFFFPFIRLLMAGRFALAAGFVFTIFLYPVWSWYIGFNFKKMNLEYHLSHGWVIATGDAPRNNSNDNNEGRSTTKSQEIDSSLAA